MPSITWTVSLGRLSDKSLGGSTRLSDRSWSSWASVSRIFKMDHSRIIILGDWRMMSRIAEAGKRGVV
jgi:hypothetical protein